jgi:hypothetical protein
MQSGLGLRGKVMIWMTNTSSKTLEDMLKPIGAARSPRHKMKEARTKTCEET